MRTPRDSKRWDNIWDSYPTWQSLPYGVRFDFQTSFQNLSDEGWSSSFLGIRDRACLLISDQHVVEIEHSENESLHDDANIWRAYIEGFETAAEAERAGKQFAASLMALSVAYGPPIAIRTKTPAICEVYPRRAGRHKGGILVSARTVPNVEWHKKRLDYLSNAWEKSSSNEISDRLFLALELYSAALFSQMEHSRFVGLISSIEPLVAQTDLTKNTEHGDSINELIKNLQRHINETQAIPEPVRASLSGQIANLKRESIRKASHRLIRKFFPDEPTATQIFDHAYSARSQLLHDGAPPDNFDEIRHPSEDLVRRIILTAFRHEMEDGK
jgi:hypothetical protein